MKIISENEFNAFDANQTVLVDFYADWCNPCKMLGPVLEKVSEQFNDVTFVKVNVDQEPELARKFGVMSIPAVFLVRGKETLGNFVGFQSAEKVTEFINQHK